MKNLTYAHKSPDGKIFYIGQGTKQRAYSKSGRNKFWSQKVNECGGFSVMEIAAWRTKEEALQHEIFLIDVFRGMGYELANIAIGGRGSKGFRHTAEHKEKMSAFMHENNPMNDLAIRKNHAIKVKIAMSKPETREKMRSARVGIKLSKSHVESLKNCHPMRACVVNGVYYKSLMEASRSLGILHGTLRTWFNMPNRKRLPRYDYITECRWA